MFGGFFTRPCAEQRSNRGTFIEDMIINSGLHATTRRTIMCR